MCGTITAVLSKLYTSGVKHCIFTSTGVLSAEILPKYNIPMDRCFLHSTLIPNSTTLSHFQHFDFLEFFHMIIFHFLLLFFAPFIFLI